VAGEVLEEKRKLSFEDFVDLRPKNSLRRAARRKMNPNNPEREEDFAPHQGVCQRKGPMERLDDVTKEKSRLCKKGKWASSSAETGERENI